MVALKRLSTLLGKVEATYGVDPTPTPAANGILIEDLNMKPVSELLERRPNNASLSQFAHVVGMKEYEVTFKTDLKGSGTAHVGGAGDEPEIDPLLRACGFAKTLTAESSGGAHDGDVTYDPASTSLESVTFYGYEDGLQKNIHGCKGNFRINLEAGKYGKIEWTFRGLYVAPVDAATPSGVVYNSELPVAFKAANFTIDSYAAIIQALNIDMALELAKRVSANAAEAIVGFEVTGRAVQGSINPEQVTEATKPFYADWASGKAMALAATVGNTSGAKLDITGPKVQFREITPGDREGINVYDLPLTFARNAGDNEIKLKFY